MNNKIQFLVGEAEGGKFYVISTSGVYFCIKRDTEEEAVNAGLRAFDLFLKSKQSLSEKEPCISVKESGRTAWTSRAKYFIPKQLIKAEAVAC